MKTLLLISLCFGILFTSCSNEEEPQLFPVKFDFHHSIITEEKAFVIGDHESILQIDSKSGNLQEFRSEVANGLKGYIKSLAFGIFIESFEVISKDSVKIYVWENGSLNSYSLSSHLNNDNIEILDENFYISKISWDKTNKEVKFCMALSLGILNRNATFFPEVVYHFCENKDIDFEFQNILSENEYQNNDTLGIYLLTMVYK
jgi:hypothetical protein